MSDTLANAVQPERRRAPRYRCDLRISMDWGAAVLEGSVRDISDGGMFVELTDPLWLGARFAARLTLKDAIDLECVVRRVDPGRGMAVSYVVEEDSGRLAITALLQRLSSR